MKHRFRTLRHAWNHTRKGRVAVVLLLAFGLVNVALYAYYRDRTYPGAAINGRQVGSIRLGDLPGRISKLDLLPASIRLTYHGSTTQTSPAALGMTVDAKQTAGQLVARRSWLPVANLLTSRDSPFYIAVAPMAYRRTITEIGRSYHKDAANASLAIKDGDFVINPEVPAQSIDGAGSQAHIIDALSHGRDQAELMMQQTPPITTRDSLSARLKSLEAQRHTGITLTYQGKSRKFTPEEITSWYVPSDKGYSLSTSRIADSIADGGLDLDANVNNAAQLAGSVQQDVSNAKPASLALGGPVLGKKSFTFCTATRGVPDSELSTLDRIAASALNDAGRGWSLGGNVTFTKGSANCDFTIWLVAPDQMASFGAICDPVWSCTVSPNVVINYDRWRYTTGTWSKSKGSLEDYRKMAINHETGHWLGFEHSTCPVPGQPAPVMEQQSIDLDGCAFNPWPTPTERVTLKNALGL